MITIAVSIFFFSAPAKACDIFSEMKLPGLRKITTNSATLPEQK